jgi:DNA-binding FadR family transcriptional regulator
MRKDEMVAAHVRALIASRRLKPGDKLPTQQELADELNVSKNAVFWGLTSLRAEGLIIGIQGGRARVAGVANEEPSAEETLSEGG